MKHSIQLYDYGIRLFSCRLFNHDYLWFSSYEISKLSTVLPILHNYALTYSLGDYSYGISREIGPRYEEDFMQIQLYATPALATYWSRTRITYNAINSRTLRTDDKPSGINSPDLGWRNYLDPVFSSNKRAAQKFGFSCYVFTFNDRQPKGVTRLGKKGAAIRILWKEIEKPRAVFKEEPVRPDHPLNPLDISGDIVSYEPVMLPPHLLLRTAEITNDWFVFSELNCVHVPGRILKKCQS